METTTDKDQPSGEGLYAAGWRQGVVFEAPSACFLHNSLDSTGETLRINQRLVRTKEKLVLVTQDCDIKADPNEEPYIEALICDTVKGSRAIKLDRNSARYFVIDPATNLVAEARYRLVLDKKVLLKLSFKPWPSTQERLERFVRWLARRYDRPAIPDPMYDAFQRPIEDVLENLETSNPELGRAFSSAIHEIRVNLPEHETPPFDLELMYLIKKDGLTEEEVEAIFALTDAIHQTLDTQLVHLAPDPRIVTLEEISMAEYYATRPLFLEYLTYRGTEVQGATPFRRG